jgi:hypothetical protein
LEPELGPHAPGVEPPQRHDVIAEHERIASDARDPVHAGASWRAPAGPEQHHDRPHRQPRRRHRGAGIVEQPARDVRSPRALDLHMHRRFAAPVADAKQAIGRALPRPIHAEIERAKRLEPAARKRQRRIGRGSPRNRCRKVTSGSPIAAEHDSSHL